MLHASVRCLGSMLGSSEFCALCVCRQPFSDKLQFCFGCRCRCTGTHQAGSLLDLDLDFSSRLGGRSGRELAFASTPDSVVVVALSGVKEVVWVDPRI